MTSPYDVGLWQEILIWKVITDVLERKLGPATKNTTQVGYVKQTLTWPTGTHTYEVKWHTPNTHPGEPGKFSSPEFGILVDQDRVMNIESKNWAVDYKPLSADSTQSQIVSRFQYLTANQNILIITDSRSHQSVEHTRDSYRQTSRSSRRLGLLQGDLPSAQTNPAKRPEVSE
jgi:hypothetical protein